MGKVSGRNGYMNIHLPSKQDWYFINGDISCVNCFINIYTLFQFNDSSSFKVVDTT